MIATLLGLREENTLACLFLLMWCTQMFGLLTELLARPSLDTSGEYGSRGWANDPKGNESNRSSRFYAYAARMFPHVLGFFPYITCWVVVLNYFIASLEDTRKEDQDLWEQIPDFVQPAVFGTMLIFSSFTFVQCVAKPRPPRPPHLTAPTPTIFILLHVGGSTSIVAPTTGGRPSCGTLRSASPPSCSSAGSSTATCFGLRRSRRPLRKTRCGWHMHSAPTTPCQ